MPAIPEHKHERGASSHHYCCCWRLMFVCDPLEKLLVGMPPCMMDFRLAQNRVEFERKGAKPPKPCKYVYCNHITRRGAQKDRTTKHMASSRSNRLSERRPRTAVGPRLRVGVVSDAVLLAHLLAPHVGLRRARRGRQEALLLLELDAILLRGRASAAAAAAHYGTIRRDRRALAGDPRTYC